MSSRVLLDPTGMKVSKPGFDVTTATLDQLIFDAANQGLQVHQTGTVSLAGPAATGSPHYSNSPTRTFVTFPDLGYVPLVLSQSSYGGKVRGGGGWSPADPMFVMGNRAEFNDWGVGNHANAIGTLHDPSFGGGALRGKLWFTNPRATTITWRYIIFNTRGV